MTDITVIKRSMESQIRQIAEMLLPGGRMDGREWCAGSIRGEAGKSLKVCISGAKLGVWSDFASGEGGDAIDLWKAAKGQSLVEALDDIRSYLGLQRPEFERHERTYRRPAPPKAKSPSSAVLDYLVDKRKITEEAISAYRVGENDRTIVLPSFLPNGDLGSVKYLGIDRKDGRKQIRVEADCEPMLFGWQAIAGDIREIVITEGELDAITMWDYSFPALSVPFGGGKAGKQQWIESEFERLLRFEVIYLALDNDAEGEAAAEEIANRLGRHRCRRVTLPWKDANECMTNGVEQPVIAACIASAKTLDPPELRRAGEFTERVKKLFWPTGGEEPGYRLPFAKIGNRLHFRPGEVTVWLGPTGAGKSQILSYSAVGWGDAGSRLCIASLEMVPPQYLKRMVKQAANLDRPTADYIDAIMGWFNDWIYVFDVVGKRTVGRLIDVFEYARCRYGCDQFIVDSLMRLGVGSEDYEGQEKAVFELVNWTVEKGVHLHLVAHARKADREGNLVPEIEDIKGASEIGANAFNVIAIWRNKKLEDQIKSVTEAANKGDIIAQDKIKELKDMPTVILNVCKQRNGDWEGKTGIWFNTETYQYRSSMDAHLGRRYAQYSILQDERAAL